MSCYPLAPVSRSASAVSVAPPIIKLSCSNASDCKSPLASILQTCSEDFDMPALKIKDLPLNLRKLG